MREVRRAKLRNAFSNTHVSSQIDRIEVEIVEKLHSHAMQVLGKQTRRQR
jgi:hypothetical protein